MEKLVPNTLMVFLIILFIWNLIVYYKQPKDVANKNKKYYELDAKLNFVIAVGSLAIFIVSYLGYDVKEEILKKSETPINEMVKAKSHEIDSLLESKNILKAGIYIVNGLEYKEGKKFRFKDFLTIDNKHLPDFGYSPKLIINSSTGENLRIVKVTSEYFILSKPLLKSGYLQLDDNPYYPDIVKFDVWIADYKNHKN